MGQSPRRLTKPSLTLYVFYELFGILDRQIERPTIAVIALNLHKDGQSRERILPTTATPPCPSGLTIAASPKLIWMLSAALMFGKCVISTVLVRSRAGQTLLRPSQSPALRLAFDGLRGEHRGFFQHSKVRILAPQPASAVSAPL